MKNSELVSGQIIYYVDFFNPTGYVSQTTWHYPNSFHDELVKSGAAFHTREEAAKRAKQLIDFMKENQE